MIPCECCCDDKKVRDLEKKVNKAVYSVAVNGEIIYPTDGVGNVNLGDIGGSTDARDIKMPDGTSVAVNIDDLNTAVKDAVSEVIPTPVTDGINLNETDGNGTVSRMLIRADDTLKFDGLNVGISEATDARITQAQADATTAGTKADDAQADADDAMTAANKAIVNINTGMEITDDYLKYALNEAHNNGVTGKTSLFAVDRADLNMMNVSDTFPILQLSDDAKTKINGAISAIGASVVDTALEMNIDKADGSTATESLFSIGDGLEWVEGVLKATASSGGHTVTYTNYTTNFKFADWLKNASNGLYILNTMKGYTLDYFSTKVLVPTAATITATAYGYKLDVTSTNANYYVNTPIFIFKNGNSALLFTYNPFIAKETRSTPLTVDDSTANVDMVCTTTGIDYINQVVNIDDVTNTIGISVIGITTFEYEGLSESANLSISTNITIPTSYVRVVSIAF